MSNILVFSLFLLTSLNTYANSNCRQVTLKGLTVKETETREYCFLKEPTYFLSKNCQSMDCVLIRKLKKTKVGPSTQDRPGVHLCKALGGGVDQVMLMDSKITTFRCVYSEDMSSVSLNLLESWNGKIFTGPSEPVKF